MDGIFHVVRAFESDEVTHVDDSVDPVRDLETIQYELCQKDLVYVQVRDDAAMQKLRIVTLRFGTGRQKRVLEQWTNPKLSRRTCTCAYGLQSCRGK